MNHVVPAWLVGTSKSAGCKVKNSFEKSNIIEEHFRKVFLLGATFSAKEFVSENWRNCPSSTEIFMLEINNF
jgi:hypothetical protein